MDPKVKEDVERRGERGRHGESEAEAASEVSEKNLALAREDMPVYASERRKERKVKCHEKNQTKRTLFTQPRINGGVALSL